ncbi:amino acid ABC transporter ATP-binding protein [Christensenella tenuis]|jgi:ABC-type polar amino acid transport system ATPase subunit|uniref:Amino acid ABC transporter ATP-binding protein n=1 Tax=Christensenella tenuis TaxID=2763033 RepID=A0ABR7EED0_9FIRM|nr:amino acid ABC transporter ATP-binding protein [Christensenella tenuis]MBC5647379.1 amino acid ABC transporter ATP-binding protein [Christensenella tenuis]
MSVLEVNKLNKSFGGTHVLKDVDLSLEKGETMAIIGPSGSGKSTLLRCINCLERAEKGKIILDGITIAEEKNGITEYLPDEQLRDARLHLGMVFQNFNLFPHLNVLENLTLAPINVDHVSKEKAAATAMDLLKKVGLADRADAYPCELSGGQSQRVAIARALAMDPDILCFDEPTSALDPELTGEVLQVIKGLAAEHMTMLIVTHEMGFAKEVASQVVFMDDGRILERGTPDELLVNPKEARIRSFLDKLLSV